jgi:hypothetical protein
MPEDDRPAGVREQEFFRLASTWADIVREGAKAERQEARPERQTAYHRSEWHYINWFWRPGLHGPVDATDLLPSSTNVVERLQSLVKVLPDSTRPAGERAIDLAWVLHLVGDIHQPLHTSARVTETEPRGDAGGNLFKLDGDRNLHAYWDGIVDRSVRRRAGETDGAYVIRIARLLHTHHPPGTLRPRLKPGQYEAWGRESLAIAKRKVYPPSLTRGVEPSSRYRRVAWATSAEQIALAGHRLAAVLQELFRR